MSRLDKLKEQHPELNISVIDIIGRLDPTKTYKYHESLHHPKYREYKEWKNESYRRRVVREHYEHGEPLIQSVSRKKSWLIW